MWLTKPEHKVTCHRQDLHFASDVSLLCGAFASPLRFPRRARTTRFPLIPPWAAMAYRRHSSLSTY